MKLSLYLCALAVAALPLTASAQSKRMGPSAIEAARLKKYPPPNYLSHYLPDDRYKIAGNVWKYVSTDLDTYYHIPSSANMMRQPANRVIGFANSHDAEEAGYEPDPTDGTSRQVASATAKIETTTHSLTLAEASYLIKMTQLLDPVFKDFNATNNNIDRAVNREKGAPPSLSSYSAFAAQSLLHGRRSLAAFSRLSPPPRFRTGHRMIVKGLVEYVNSAIYLNKAIKTGDISNISDWTRSFITGVTLLGRGVETVKRVQQGK